MEWRNFLKDNKELHISTNKPLEISSKHTFWYKFNFSFSFMNLWINMETEIMSTVVKLWKDFFKLFPYRICRRRHSYHEVVRQGEATFSPFLFMCFHHKPYLNDSCNSRFKWALELCSFLQYQWLFNWERNHFLSGSNSLLLFWT